MGKNGRSVSVCFRPDASGVVYLRMSKSDTSLHELGFRTVSGVCVLVQARRVNTCDAAPVDKDATHDASSVSPL